MNDVSPPSIIYIMGFGRSGSTIIEKVLGTLPEVTPCGEVEYLFQRGVLNQELCSCGRKADECQFWKEPIGRLQDHIRKIYSGDSHAYLKDKRRHERLLSVFLRFWQRRRSGRYFRVESDILQAIARNSGTSFLIDSSKSPGRALSLRQSAQFNVKILHLLRDSRAVAYSWSKLKWRIEVTSRVEYMPRYSPFAAAFYWLIYNIASLFVVLIAGKDAMVKKYEDICREPEKFARELSDFLGIDAQKIVPFLRGNVDICLQDHMISGNPIRFKRKMRFIFDEEWKIKLPRIHKIVVTLVTFPLLKLYRYRI